jgi:hypothetical protein
VLTFVVSVHLPTVASVKAAYMIAIKTKKRLPPLQIETEIICHVACTWVSAEVTVVYATKRGWRLGPECLIFAVFPTGSFRIINDERTIDCV